VADLILQLGVKTDPTEYRFSYPWLFRLLADQGVRYVQLGTFFEIYQLPDEYFHRLRREAENQGVCIHSIFTTHRELGGFFNDEPGWEAVARRNFERLIEVGALLGAQSVGSNPGAVYRDRMDTKRQGIQRYLRHLKELTQFAHERGVPWLTIEPMSCLAEPPTVPQEIRQMADELADWQRAHPDSAAQVGYCTDIAHGYADEQGTICHDHLELLEATLPHLYELHLKNTDERYCSTFGFSEADRQRGIVEIEPVREMLRARAASLPVREVVGYLEIGGPKLGRDYSDHALAQQLRDSLAYLKQVWPTDAVSRDAAEPAVLQQESSRNGRPVRVAPSVMCVDMGHIETAVRRLEGARADMLHLDVADGHFVPNLLLGLDVIRRLRAISDLPMDAHLMVANPEQYIEPLAKIGVEYVSVHAEACDHLDRVLTEIRRHGMKAGVALNPATPLHALQYVLERLDFVLLMTVNPGFAGQKLVAAAIRKIADCRRFLADCDPAIPIMVDGNVSFQHIPNMVAAGADILVAGTSSWFDAAGSLTENVRKTEEAIVAGLKMRTA